MSFCQYNSYVMEREDEDQNVIPGEWRDRRDLPDITRHLGANRDTLTVKYQRDILKVYYNYDACAVALQDRMIHSGCSENIRDPAPPTFHSEYTKN